MSLAIIISISCRFHIPIRYNNINIYLCKKRKTTCIYGSIIKFSICQVKRLFDVYIGQIVDWFALDSITYTTHLNVNLKAFEPDYVLLRKWKILYSKMLLSNQNKVQLEMTSKKRIVGYIKRMYVNLKNEVLEMSLIIVK